MPKLNPKDAPPGFIAVAQTSSPALCHGCHFFEQVPIALDGGCQCPEQYECTPAFRKDKRGVIFVKDTEQPCL